MKNPKEPKEVVEEALREIREAMGIGEKTKLVDEKTKLAFESIQKKFQMLQKPYIAQLIEETKKIWVNNPPTGTIEIIGRLEICLKALAETIYQLEEVNN